HKATRRSGGTAATMALRNGMGKRDNSARLLGNVSRCASTHWRISSGPNGNQPQDPDTRHSNRRDSESYAAINLEQSRARSHDWSPDTSAPAPTDSATALDADQMNNNVAPPPTSIGTTVLAPTATPGGRGAVINTPARI